MKRIGFYSGSFDPVTLGHTDVIERACRLVDKLVIGVGVHTEKAPLFTAPERIDMLKGETKVIARSTGTEIEIVTFANLAVDAAAVHEAAVIFRGTDTRADGTKTDHHGTCGNARARGIDLQCVEQDGARGRCCPCGDRFSRDRGYGRGNSSRDVCGRAD